MLGIRKFQGIALDIYQGDITSFVSDILVNAANKSLAAGGGVDGAIRRVGGPVIDKACQAIGRCAEGEAVTTPAGDLPAKHLIHTVGPHWQGGQQGEAEILARCYQNCLALAEDIGGGHISFPAISTGIFGYPVAEAASVAMQATRRFLEETQPTKLHRISFVCFSTEDYQSFQSALFATFPDQDS